MTKTGGCMCGAVRFSAENVPENSGACHCEMCRRWTGSALLGVTVPADGVTWDGAGNIATLQSSPWAARSWCSKCGSALYYRVTAEGDFSKTIEMPIGLFDDPNGFTMTNEIYIDHKPDSFAYAGTDRAVLTRAQTLEKFGVTLDETQNERPQE